MLSIITPIYNGECFIEKCINVVINQNCPQLEHIIVDGGSTDKTVDIIQQYAEKYPHIRWISEKDRGQSDAMNKGIAMAKGNIVGFLNVDDYYEPNVLNRVLQLFQALPEPSLLVGNCNVLNSENQIRFINKPKKLKLANLLLGHAVNPFPMNPSAYFYHTSLHKTAGLYNVDEHYTLDVDFLLRAVQVAHTQYVDEVWGNYLQLDGTKTVEDMRNGTSSMRVDRLMKHYRKQLNLPQRWIVAISYQFYQMVDWNRIKYFLYEPKNIQRVLTRKLKRFHQKTNAS